MRHSSGEPAVLEVIGLSARAPDGTQLVHDVTFCVPRGSLIGIAGPTGAGKSSLVRVLTGSLSATSGRVLLRGSDLTGDPSLRRRIGLVPQENVLHRQLRLRRALGYGAALRLPGRVPAADRQRRVRSLLGELGLERQAGVRIGSLSGGQRQRANVAMEMVGEPDILILDEPTSSLDPGYEKTVLETLRGLADRGHSVLTVTHSMAALMECDRVLFLAAGGQQAYFGPPREALAYLGRESAPELFSDLDADGDRRWGDRFRASPDFARYALASSLAGPTGAKEIPPGASPLRQLSNLLGRGVEQIVSDRRHTAMLALQGAVLGILLLTFLGAGGLRPVQGHPLTGARLAAVTSVAQLLALTVVWLGLANSIREIVKERATIEREHSAGLSLRVYLGSKFLVFGSVSVVEAGILSAIATARQNPPASGAVLSSGTLELAVTLAAAGLASTALGLLLSAMVRSPDKALAGLPVVVVAEFVLSGLEPAVRWLPGLDHLHDLAASYWAIQGIQATITGDSRAWWTALAALGVTTAVTLAAGSVLLTRGFRPRPVGSGSTAGGVLAAWGRWSEQLAGSRTAIRAVAGSLLVVVAAGSAVATGLKASPARAALPAPVGHSGHPVGAAAVPQPAEPPPGRSAAAPVKATGSGKAASSSGAPMPEVPRAPAVSTPAAVVTVSRIEPTGAGAATGGHRSQPTVHAPGPGVDSHPAVKPVAATTPTTVISPPSVPAPTTGIQVPVTTPTTTPAVKQPLAPVAGTTTYSPLAAAEKAMAAAIAEAWTLRMEQALRPSNNAYLPLPGSG